MKFIVDGMLGSFTRWLRILGYEAEYFKDTSDSFLLERAASENATLLTRDIDLLKRAKDQGLQAFYVEGENEADRLSNIAGKLSLRLYVDNILSRCPACGSTLKRVSVDDVRGMVTEGTLSYYNEFWKCTVCGKIYWQGRHWKKINETLEKARNLLKERGISPYI
jgi:uncharacterized protein with PIN domain